MNFVNKILIHQHQINQQLINNIQIEKLRESQMSNDENLEPCTINIKLRQKAKQINIENQNQSLFTPNSSSFLDKKEIKSIPMKKNLNKNFDLGENKHKTVFKKNEKKIDKNLHRNVQIIKQLLNGVKYPKQKFTDQHSPSSFKKYQKSIAQMNKNRNKIRSKTIKSEVSAPCDSSKSVNLPTLTQNSKSKLKELYNRKKFLHHKLQLLDHEMDSIKQIILRKKRISSNKNMKKLQPTGSLEGQNQSKKTEIDKAKMAVQFIQKINSQTKERRIKNMKRHSRKIEFTLRNLDNEQSFRKISPSFSKRWVI